MDVTIVGLKTNRPLRVIVDHKMTADLIERDSDEFVTIYGPEVDGQCFYLILDQEVIDKLKTI